MTTIGAVMMLEVAENVKKLLMSQISKVIVFQMVPKGRRTQFITAQLTLVEPLKFPVFLIMDTQNIMKGAMTYPIKDRYLFVRIS